MFILLINLKVIATDELLSSQLSAAISLQQLGHILVPYHHLSSPRDTDQLTVSCLYLTNNCNPTLPFGVRGNLSRQAWKVPLEVKDIKEG